ncbi:ganglioside-induced differentiation-associated protein 1 isoform X3 [Ambystoma mexicanum]
MPEEGSMYYPRVQHYRELLDSLPMDAYTHGCILHPELTVDSMIPAYATTRIRSQIGNTETELKKLAQENPDLQDAYIAKQKRIKTKLLEHDNVKYLKKILDELEKVLDQVETELQRRNEESPDEGQELWLCGQFFSLADVSLAVTLHRLKFLGFARRNWGNGKRPNLENYYERILKRRTFRRVLGNVNNILISAVLPTAFRVAKKRAPTILGTTVMVGMIAGVGYLLFLCMRKRISTILLSVRTKYHYF